MEAITIRIRLTPQAEILSTDARVTVLPRQKPQADLPRSAAGLSAPPLLPADLSFVEDVSRSTAMPSAAILARKVDR